MRIIFDKNNQKGYVALISVLIVSALSLAIGIGVSIRSINGAYMSLSYNKFHQSYSLATSCMHKALISLERDLGYVGNEDIIIEGKTCHIYTIEGTGNEDRIIKTEASLNDFFSRIRVEVSYISPTLQISSWKNVIDF